MHSVTSYILVAGAGLLVTHLLTRAPELRRLRLSQMIFVPVLFMAALAVLPDPTENRGVMDIGALVLFLIVLGMIIVLLAPNIAYGFGTAVTNLLDPMDWTPLEEEIALRPIHRLIDKGLYHDAFDELETLLKTHKPTFEALHIRAKLLNHFQRFDETIATLLQMLRLSNSAPQQVLVMELLAGLEAHQPGGGPDPERGERVIRIDHSLVLLNPASADLTVNKEIPPGSYTVEAALRGRHRWLLLKGEAWGNAEACWKAVEEVAKPADSAVKRSFLYRVSSLHQRVVIAITGKSFRQAKEESRALAHDANQFIREAKWAEALPLLRQASKNDPDNYEIAYRLAQAAQQVCRRPEAADILEKVLEQSRWTEDQERMLKQLKP